MSFVPLSGPARFTSATPPRESVIEFTGNERTVPMPIRGALPILTKAQHDEDAHPSVALLAASAVLGLRLVAAGRFEPAPDGMSWQPVLDVADAQRLQLLAEARAYGGLDSAAAHGIAYAVLTSVVDGVPRRAPSVDRLREADAHEPSSSRSTTGTVRRPARRSFAERLQARIAGGSAPAGTDGRPNLVTLTLRIEADEDELRAGAVRVVPQVHDAQNHLHVADAVELWLESGPDARHGFGDRARTHTTLALRAAAEAWPVLDRLLDLRVPDQIVLETDELVGLLDEGVAALAQQGTDVLWPRSLGRDLTTSAQLEATPRATGDGKREEPLVEGLFGTDTLFAFRWQVALHGEPLTDAEMDELAHATSPIIKLRDNWTVVDPSVAKKAKKRLVRSVKPAQALAATMTGVVDVGEQTEQVVVGASIEKVREQIRNAATRDPIDTPAALQAELRGYQRHGLTWLADLTGLGLGACLADDMGLGKTITLIALHLHRRANDARDQTSTGPTLVVCPASLLGNWEAEIRRFAPGTDVRRFHGTRRDLSGVGDGFVLTTYQTMRRDAAALDEVPWDLVVADEAQHVKNPASSTARALRTIGSRARVALTGTPVENNLTELWAILDWAIPGLLGSRNAFRKRWAAPIEAGVDPAITRQFADLVEPFLLRRRKSDPGIAPELPAKTETDHLIGLTREQVVLYEALVRDSMDRIGRADEEARRGLVLKLLTGLKQICNHPAQYLKQSNPRLTGRSEKLDLLDELLGTVLAEDGAVLIFTQYVAMGRLLEQHLSRLGVPHQFLHGGTPVGQREEMVRRFQSGDGVPVFLLSLKAGGTGLNLTAADHVIHFDRWWNPAVETQATDRAYRIGQTRPVQVHRIVAEGTIEERVAELLAKKTALAESVLGAGEAALTELDDDELRDLVTLRRPS